MAGLGPTILDVTAVRTNSFLLFCLCQDVRAKSNDPTSSMGEKNA